MLRIEGAVAQPITLTLDDLRDHYQPFNVDISYANDARIVNASFTGARLWDILEGVDVAINTEKPDRMRVMVRSVDGFRCVVKWNEFDPSGDNKLILVAYIQDGQPIQSRHGPLRLVVPGDAQGLRYIGNLTSITVLNTRAGDE
ncbi:MAG: molybdopterin-dependent oxidoreductase [Anaerolineae bacterium]|nr:molybdopterin-dependent oxidoreductase [Anaerolineae bacterium]